MSITVIACGVFRTDLKQLISASTRDLTVRYLEGGLHSEPHRLRRELQKLIDEETGAERIVLLYGLCGTGSAGLQAGTVPLAIPRVHDCISLFLGSNAAYGRQFRDAPGTYYISAGWYDEQVQPKGKRDSDPSTDPVRLSNADASPEELTRRYGGENAEAILKVTHSWKKNYKRAVFIDTGAGDRQKYAGYVDAMGNEFGWKTETLSGSTRLIERALTATETDEEILIVPPGAVTFYDAAAGRLDAGSPEEREETYSVRPRRHSVPGNRSPRREGRIGLGIDAGGTYTDAVLFDLSEGKVLAKAKSLTTPWDYTEGISAALGLLPAGLAVECETVAISTTLATNAIVEDNRQGVGLLLMPLEGAVPPGIDHAPTALIQGRMTITGEILEPVDPEQVRRIGREMADGRGVRAFAVSGYGGAVNPAHEREVAALLREETGLMVCTGHELSGRLDFTVRAATAVLNAGIIPHLETFFHAAEECLRRTGIDAPVLFVRGDGFLMNSDWAIEHPIETALSGPAASIAGARYLTGLDEAAVIDVGGTTSDIGYITDGAVESDPDGAMIGSHRTHVRAVDMLTLGLGGDSRIIFDRGRISVGPRRVTPLCRLTPEERPLLTQLLTRIDELGDTSAPALIYRSTGKETPFAPDRLEERALTVLRRGARTLLDLAAEMQLGHWRFLKLDRLLSVRCIEPLGLTPTDLLHCDGRLSLGDPEAARLGLALHARLAGEDEEEFARRCWEICSRTLSAGILAKLLGLDPADPVIDLLIRGGSDRAALSVAPRALLTGLGAAAPFLLAGAAEALGCSIILPDDGDVANAIGAVTSAVHAVVSGSVFPASGDGFRITGTDGVRYSTLAEAEAALEGNLVELVRRRALAAGTSEDTVTVTVVDRTGETAAGGVVLLERRIEAEIRGVPDRP